MVNIGKANILPFIIGKSLDHFSILIHHCLHFQNQDLKFRSVTKLFFVAVLIVIVRLISTYRKFKLFVIYTSFPTKLNLLLTRILLETLHIKIFLYFNDFQTCLDPCQISMMELFPKIVNGFQVKVTHYSHKKLHHRYLTGNKEQCEIV